MARTTSTGIIGTYLLALWLDGPQSIRVGRLGEVRFPAGWALYAGSARGAGGLGARLARHRRLVGDDKRAHWHVDHLRQCARWGGAWGRASVARLECRWAAELLSLPGAELVAPRFGASDCRCRAHLVHVPALPHAEWFAHTLGAERIWMEEDRLDVLLRALGSGDDDGREAAALALGGLGAEAVVPLSAVLATGGSDERWWAARALAEVGGEAPVAPLVGALDDRDADVRACACLALGHLGHGSAAPPLAACLADTSAFVAGIAADALRMIGEPAVEALVGALGQPSPQARVLAVRALGHMRSAAAVGPLYAALDDPSYLVRHDAAEALETLGVGMVYLAP